MFKGKKSAFLDDPFKISKSFINTTLYYVQLYLLIFSKLIDMIVGRLICCVTINAVFGCAEIATEI